MEDGKALNQTSNFWNGLLEEDGNPLPVTLDLDALEQGRASTPKFDRSIGYCSDALSLYSKHLPGDEIIAEPKTKPSTQILKCQTDVGRSHFTLSRTKSDQLLHLKLKTAASNLTSSMTTTPIKLDESSDPVLQIKAEPADETSPATPAIVSSTTDPVVAAASPQDTLHVIKQEQIVTSCDATASHDYAAPVPCVVSHAATPTIIPTMVKSATLIRTSGIIPGTGQIWQQQNNSQGMTTTTAITAAGLRRQINGPQGKKNKKIIY